MVGPAGRPASRQAGRQAGRPAGKQAGRQAGDRVASLGNAQRGWRVIRYIKSTSQSKPCSILLSFGRNPQKSVEKETEVPCMSKSNSGVTRSMQMPHERPPANFISPTTWTVYVTDKVACQARKDADSGQNSLKYC